MLLPDKHISVSESILGLSSVVIERLQIPMNVDGIWGDFAEVNHTKSYPAYHTFENLLLALTFLYAVGLIDKDEEGRLYRCG